MYTAWLVKRVTAVVVVEVKLIDPLSHCAGNTKEKENHQHKINTLAALLAKHPRSKERAFRTQLQTIQDQSQESGKRR